MSYFYTNDLTCDECLVLLENVYSKHFNFTFSNLNLNSLDLHINFTEKHKSSRNIITNNEDIVNELKSFQTCKNELLLKYEIITKCLQQHIRTLCELNDLLDEKKKKFAHRIKTIVNIENAFEDLEPFDDNMYTLSNLKKNTLDIKNEICCDFFQDIDKHKSVYDNSKKLIAQIINFFESNNNNNDNTIKCKNTCSICQLNELSHFTIPCGHTFCKECCDKMTTYCFFCRQHILRKTALYF